MFIETSQTGMQQLTREIERISGSVGLRMNANKCKIMVSSAWEDNTAVITEGTEVELVEDFCYLGSNISRLGNCDKECTMRIGKASSVFGRLLNIWKSKNISLPVKVKLYESLVISTLLYGAELWPLPVTDEETGSSSSQVPTKTARYHVERQSEK